MTAGAARPLLAPRRLSPSRSYADPVHAPVRGAVVRALARRMARLVDVRIVLPDGTSVPPPPHAPVFSVERSHSPRREVIGTASAHERPTMRIHSWAFFDRVGVDAKIGVGEGFMAGEWSPAPGTDLADLLTPFAARLTDLVPPSIARFRRLAEPRHPRHHLGDRQGAATNIAHHYDLSNEVFATFLDPTMTYSAAWFAPVDPAGFDGLEPAQRRKVDGMLDYARVGPGARVLEIGSGWGQLAIQAARRGADVHTITLSARQRDLARARFAQEGVADRVRIDLRDYRDVQGTYDAVVSVEMIEAVGYDYWPDYFAALARLTAPGGTVALQAITMAHDRMLASRHAHGWIQKYVFPGGLIPSVEAIETHAAAVGLVITAERSLGEDYARTLRLWRERFVAQRHRVLALGFDPTFLRVWEFYLAYSEAGFRSGHLDVRQLRLDRRAD
ncbi:MAG: class I SAM-dependent methyltransferase [Dermatophilaceae bacterium]